MRGRKDMLAAGVDARLENEAASLGLLRNADYPGGWKLLRKAMNAKAGIISNEQHVRI